MNFIDDLKNEEIKLGVYRLALKLSVNPKAESGLTDFATEQKVNRLLLTAFLARYSHICNMDERTAEKLASEINELVMDAITG